MFFENKELINFGVLYLQNIGLKNAENQKNIELSTDKLGWMDVANEQKLDLLNFINKYHPWANFQLNSLNPVY